MASIDKGASEDTKTDKKSGPGATPGTPEKDPKDKPETGKVGEDPNKGYDENNPPPHKQPHSENIIHNRDQDPNHPANKTPAYAGDPSPRPVAEGITVPPEEMMTEQEKEAAGGGDPNAGVGPVSASRTTTGPAETIEDLGIGPRTPYPTGNPPPSEEHSTMVQGIWKGDEEDYTGGPNARTKDEYHRGDTIADGPDRDRARREKERDAQRRGPVDPRPQPRIGGAQEVATPPKGSAA